MASNRIDVHITAENEEFIERMEEIIREIRRAEGAADNAGGSFSGFGSKLAGLGMIVTGMYAGFQMLSAAIDATAGSVLKYGMAMENSQAAFEVFLGNSQLAAQYTQDLKKIAADTPFDLPGVMTAGKKLLAFGFDANTALGLLRTIGDASAGLGLGTEGVDRITLAIGQIKAKGRVMGDELLQLTEAGIPAQEILAEKLHLTADQVKNIGDAGIDADTAIKALNEGMSDRFGGMAEKLSNNMEGLLSTIKDNIQNIAGFASQPLFDGIKAGLTQIRDMTDSFVGVINGTTEVDPDSGLVRVVAGLQLGMEKACDLVQQFAELFGSFDDDGTFYMSEETVDKLDKAKVFFEQIYQLVMDTGAALVSLTPIFEEILSQVGWWISLLISVADTIVNMVKAGADDANDSFATTKVIIDLIVDALAGFMIINTIISMVKALATTYLAVKAAVLGIVTALKKATIAQAAWNAMQALGSLLKTPAGALAAGAVVGIGAGATASGWLPQKISELTSGLEDAFHIRTDTTDDAVDKKVESLINKNRNTTTTPYPGAKPSAVQQGDKKLSQEQLKANKEALQQQTELIKANLDAQLEAIKDTMESIQLAFDQARIGWAAYGVEKTQNDVQQEQARIDAIKQQIAAVQDSDAYKTQDAMNAAIGKLRIELEKHERALEKLTDVQKDVANVIAAYGGKSVTPNLDAQKAGQGQPVPEGATNSEAALYSAYQAVKNTDKTGQLTYDLLLGMAQQESGLAHWDEKGNVKTSFDGGIGLMQLTSDYAKGLAGDPYDLYKNALGGAKYLVELLNQYGNLHTALARYNGSGPAAEQYADSVLGHAQEQNARATYLLSQPQVGSGYGATSAVSGGVIQGIDAGFQAWENQTMENMRVGCVEAVRKIGSWYSDFLAKEATNNVPQLQKDAENAGVPEIPYDESKLKPGDVIVYDGNKHVLVYRGNGRTVGNSSGALDNIYGKGQGPGKVIEQGIDIGMPPTSIIQTGTYGVASNLAGMVDYDPKTNTGEAIKKKALENNKLAQEAMKQYLELSGDISTIPIEQLIQQIHDMQKKLRANGHNKEADSLNVVLAAKQNELEFKTQANYLKTAMNIIQSNASDMVYKIGNGMYDAADMAKKYLGYINGGNYPGGKFSIKTIMDKLRQELKKAEELSDVSSMAEITKTIQGIQDDLVKMVKNFQQAVEDRAAWRSNMIDANYGLSSGQKERAKKEVEREKQAESARINRGLSEEYYQSSRTAPDAKQRETDLAIADYYSRQAALNEELAKTPSLLKEIRKTAKDSLEDGLVTFLTDGVNQAESLAEAFRNMATSILKELQKVFAKHITADIMDKWFPGQNNTGNATSEDYHTTQEYSAQIGQYGQKLMMDMGNFQSSVVTAADGFDSALQGVTSRVVSSLLSATSSVSAATASAGSSYSFSMPSITGADLQHRADGGAIAGPGTETSDSIPIMASNKEYMVRAAAHKKYGTAMLDAINNGSLYEYLQRTLGRIQDGTFANFRVRVHKFAKGGAIGAAGADAAGRFTADLGASFSTPVHINNYVDGRRVVDTDLIRTIVQKENARSAKLNSVLQRRF